MKVEFWLATKKSESAVEIGKFPPVYSKQLDTFAFQKIAKAKNLQVKIRPTKGNWSTIQANSKEDHEMVKQILRQSDAGGHTYPRKEEKKQALVLKNLPHEYEEELKEEIERESGVKVEIKPLKTAKSTKDGYKLNAFVVTCDAKDAKEVTKVNGLFYHIVKWEPTFRDAETASVTGTPQPSVSTSPAVENVPDNTNPWTALSQKRETKKRNSFVPIAANPDIPALTRDAT